MTETVKEKQLGLLAAMDAARDSVDENSDPMMMFRHIVRVLKVYFDADAASVLLVDVKTGETELIAAVGMPHTMGAELAREAMRHENPKELSNTAWKHTLGIRIFLDRERLVAGGIVLARDASPFPDDLVHLLKLAESQIDSAVVQARTMWRLAERHRELEAIYQIDRLRDDAPDEDSLFLSFGKLLSKHFEAEYSQIIVHNLETNVMESRSFICQKELPADSFEIILDITRDIQTTTILPAPPSFGLQIELLAAPFIILGRHLGAVIVGRERPFQVRDTRLMVAMTSQMDSAIAKNRTSLQLAARTRELEAIYRIDHIRDKTDDFDEMLKAVLMELCSVVKSEMGYLMLYNADKQSPLELKVTTQKDLPPAYLDIIQRASKEALESEEHVEYANLEGKAKSIIAVPLILNTQIIGVFGAINSVHSSGFTADDARLLSAITSQVDTAVFERLERRRMRQVMSRSVDPKVLEALLKRADDSVLSGERVIISCLFADLRGSTEWAETTEPEELVMLLNSFLGKMTDVIFKHGGTLDKFVGDEVIALFNTPTRMEQHALIASKAAIEMQMAHQQLRAEFEKQGKILPAMGIGISTGEVIAGEFGTPIRTDFTAIGRVMNLGARLCSAAEGNQIVISENTQLDIQNFARVRELEPQVLKGIHRQVKTYELLSVSE